MAFPDRLQVLFTAAAWLALAHVCAAQAASPADLGSRLLPSMVELKVQRPGGVTASGTAFAAVKDGLLVTALHVLRDATRVTATFPDGEEFDCTGVVDRDERHNLALVRVRAFGRPMLEVSPGDLAAGATVFIPVVKDGAFGVVESSVADTVVVGGVKFYRLSGQIPDGNNGSPVVDRAGKVVGVHVTLVQDNRNVEMALPSAYILGLEPSLPVQAWAPAASAGAAPAAGVAPAAGGAATAAPADDAVDAALAKAIIEVHDWWASYTPFAANLYQMMRYSTLGTFDFYGQQSKVETEINGLNWLKPPDPLRARLVQATAQMLAQERQAMDFAIKCWILEKDAPAGKRIPEAEDAANRAAAMFAAIPSQAAVFQADFQTLARQSPKFLALMPVEMRHCLGMEPRKSKLTLGVYVYATSPMDICANGAGKTLADKLRLYSGEVIVSAGGREFKPTDDIEDFKLLLESKAGSTLAVVVKLGGKTKTLTLKVPADVAQHYPRAEGDNWQV